MSPAEIAEALRIAREARERAEKATPGPWEAGDAVEEPFASLEDQRYIFPPIGEAGPVCAVSGEGNAHLIAHARSDVPALAALVERMAGVLARLPSAERIAEMRERVEEALDDTATGHGDALEILRLLAEDLSDVLDAISPPAS